MSLINCICNAYMRLFFTWCAHAVGIGTYTRLLVYTLLYVSAARLLLVYLIGARTVTPTYTGCPINNDHRTSIEFQGVRFRRTLSTSFSYHVQLLLFDSGPRHRNIVELWSIIQVIIGIIIWTICCRINHNSLYSLRSILIK